MAFSFQVVPHSLHFSISLLNPTQASPPKPQFFTHLLGLHFRPKTSPLHIVNSGRAAINGETPDEPPPKPARRTRKKGTTSSSSSSSSPPTKSKPKKTKRSTKKSKAEDKVIKDQSETKSKAEDKVIKDQSETKSKAEDKVIKDQSETKSKAEDKVIKDQSETKSKAEDKVFKDQSETEIAAETGPPEPEFEIFDDGIDVTSKAEDKVIKDQSETESKAEDKVIKDQSETEIAAETGSPEPEFEIIDDGIDVTYQDPPLVCCFGSLQKEFVPTVRVSDIQQHPDMYSEWKMMQWDPPEFARAPGGPASNVAIAYVRLGGRAAFIGRVGNDEFGIELLEMMKKENVQVHVKIDRDAKTACTEMKVKFEDKKMTMEVVKEPAEATLLTSEVKASVLKEARMFHFCSEALTSPVMKQTLYKAIEFFKKSGGLVFFDLNMPMPLWKSRDETWKLIKRVWNEASIIEVSRIELEFLLDEPYYVHLKNYKHQYYAETFEASKNRRHTYHFTREEIAPLWHDGLKFLFVTDGTLRIHFYTPTFDGVIIGTEDVMVALMTCDRTGSGDAMVAAIMRKLFCHPEMFDNQDVCERQLRFAVAAGIIAQWTTGAVRGFPTESASKNLKEQVYVPSMW